MSALNDILTRRADAPLPHSPYRPHHVPARLDVQCTRCGRSGTMAPVNMRVADRFAVSGPVCATCACRLDDAYTAELAAAAAAVPPAPQVGTTFDWVVLRVCMILTLLVIKILVLSR